MKYKAHLLPRTERLHVSEDTVVDLSDGKFDVLAESLSEFVNAVQPNVLIEHNVDGSSYGKVLETSLEDSGIYATIELNEESLPENFNPRWVSPRIAWNHVDVNGRKWPAALLETSLVSVPRFLVGQDSLVEVALSEISAGNCYLNSVEIVFAETPPSLSKESEMSKEEIIALVQELLAAALAPKEDSEDSEMACGPKTEMGYKSKMADPSVEIEVSTEDEGALPSMELAEDVTAVEDVEAYVNGLSPEDAKSQLAALIHSAKKSADEALMSEVKAELACRKIPVEKAGDFFKLAKQDRKTFQSAMSAIPRVSNRETPTMKAPLSRNANANTDPATAALAAAKRGEGSFTDLLAKYRKELI